ncbi:DapH/DapD/GlmU-related protein [Saccharopolyspora hattusasensis]|uniref:acyltransferase n=1 Tax=Saccharopolyspora hattusasensis TaxID=1128679 RepID=UPI003D950B4E
MTVMHGWIDSGGRVGTGTRIWHQAQVAAGAVVGEDCVLGKGVYLGRGTQIGNRVKIGNYSNLFGAVIADEAMICPSVIMVEDRAPRATTPEGRLAGPEDWTPHPVRIGRGATIGTGAVIAPGVTIGSYAMVAVGSVVFHDVAAHALVAGNPARQCGWTCVCGHTLDTDLHCPHCPHTYHRDCEDLTLITGGDTR